MRHVLLWVCGVLILATPDLAATEASRLLRVIDCEGPSPLARLDPTPQVEVVADPQAPSAHAMRVTVDPPAYRTETECLDAQGRITSFGVGEERWVGMRIYCPSALRTLVNPPSTSFFQFGPVRTFADPVVGTTTVGLFQLKADGMRRWRLRLFSANGRVTFGGVSHEFDRVIGDMAFDVWEDWVFHIKLRTDDSGLIEVWRNGVQVLPTADGQVHGRGRNAAVGDQARIKWGLYSGAGNGVNARTQAYFDDVAIGDGSVGYAQVVPNPALTVIGGNGSGRYAAQVAVPIQAALAPGQVFVRWEVTGPAVVADPHAAATTVTMASRAATVTAVVASGSSAPPASQQAPGDGGGGSGCGLGAGLALVLAGWLGFARRRSTDV